MSEHNPVHEVTIFSVATDPIYIGTGGYTIGRVDNTIVRDPITKIPKIPGSSLAGAWRYYVTLELQSHFKEEYKLDRKKRVEKKDNIENLFDSPKDWMKNFPGNRFAAIKCAGQDDDPNNLANDQQEKITGHCGRCIVCKAFGYSKNKESWQGMLFFSDLNIVFFPVYTRLGVRWITSQRLLQEANLLENNAEQKGSDKTPDLMFAMAEIENGKEKGFINLGWLNLPYEVKQWAIKCDDLKFENFQLTAADIIVVPDSLIAQIVNANLEVRTSVSIDPITGAAKEGALFTSEAIPRGTVFYGNLRIFDKSAFAGQNGSLPDTTDIEQALCDSKKYYETLGIGGMTTRGFGRMKVELKLNQDNHCDEIKKSQEAGGEHDGQ